MNTMTDTLPESATSDLLHSMDQLLRDVPGVLDRIRSGRDLTSFARAMIVTVLVGAGLLGASMGAFRGGVQILYAAVKLPLVLLLTTAICAPALTALNSALGRQASMQRDLSLVLAALARTSLVVAAEAPIVLLSVRLGASYHSIILLVVMSCALAGLVGLSLFFRGLRASDPRAIAPLALALFTVFGLVGSQMSWTMRPFVLRPRSPQVAFIRAIEGGFLEAVATSSRSARGLYDRDSAPLPAGETSP